MNGATYAVRLRDLEQRVDELKDQIRRSHTRLALLSDTIIGGGAAGSRSEVEFKNEMSSAFQLTRALFVIDGQVQYNRQDDSGALADQKDIPIYSGSVPPGDHTIQVALTFQGNGYGVFSYLRGYKFEVKSSHSFTAVEGKTHHGHGDGVREGRRDDAARAAADHRVAGEAAAARRRRRRGSPRRLAAPGRRFGVGSVRSAEARSESWRLGAASRCVALRRGALARDARADDAIASAQNDLDVRRPQDGRRAGGGRARARREQQTAEQRLANGELLYRMKDYAARIVVLSEILEEFPEHAQLPGRAVAPRRDVLRRARLPRGTARLPGARRARERAALPGLLRQGARAPRRRGDPPERSAETLAPVFEKFNQVPPAQIDAGLSTPRARPTSTQDSWNDATRGVLAGRQRHAVHAPGALLPGPRRDEGRAAPAPCGDAGAQAAASANYKPAIEAFRAVTELPPDTPEHQHVIDLAWMAIGRLFYEMEQYQQAREAYAKVDRDSPEFDTMLYELAWVYVRLGDVAARRAGARGAHDRATRTASTSATGRSSAPTCCFARGRSTARSQLYKSVLHAVRADARQGRRLPRLDQGRQRLLRQARAAAARPARPERRSFPRSRSAGPARRRTGRSPSRSSTT